MALKTYRGLLAEIDRLQAQADDLLRNEKRKVIAECKEVIASYGLTAADLGLKSGRPRAGVRQRGAGQPKYRDPRTGATWTGHGRPPAWIAKAKNRERFLIG